MGGSETQAADRLSSDDYRRLSALIEGTVGIRMPPAKKTMVESRLRRRLRELGLTGLGEYCRRVFGGGAGDGEIVHLIDAVTTNKTDFFREAEHFELLARTVVPALLEGRDRPGRDRPMALWSAACSIGAEPYTLAMVLDAFGRARRDLRFTILATDISTRVLAQAKRAVYPAEMMAPVPPDFRKRYFLRSRDPQSDVVRLRPEIRQRVSFGRLNLMDELYPLDEKMDVIFCRNLLIYFDKARQEAVLQRLCAQLRPGGYLFLGHTETIGGMSLPLRGIATSVYLRT